MLELKINGQKYSGWTTATISRGLMQVASTFELTVTDRWEGVPWAIAPFDACQLLWNGTVIFTGAVDQNSINYDSESHEITIVGRSKTADLVDCSCAPGEFKNQNLLQIASALCQPFGVKVLADVPVGDVFLSYKPDEGVQVFDALEKLARLRGLLLTDTGAGELLITRAGQQRMPGALELGVNILSASASFNVRERFSEYTVKAQQKGSDTLSPAAAAQVTASARDSSVPRYRPLILTAEDQADAKTAQQRADWENNVRYGRSMSFSYTVQDWEINNQLFQINRLIKITDAITGLNNSLLIAGVRYSLSAAGTVTELELASPQTFTPEPPRPEKTSITPAAAKSGILWNELNP